MLRAICWQKLAQKRVYHASRDVSCNHCSLPHCTENKKRQNVHDFLCSLLQLKKKTKKKKKTEHRVYSQGYFPVWLTVIMKLPSYCEKESIFRTEELSILLNMDWLSETYLKTTAAILTRPSADDSLWRTMCYLNWVILFCGCRLLRWSDQRPMWRVKFMNVCNIFSICVFWNKS